MDNKIKESMDKLLNEKKVVSVVDVFIDIGILNIKDYEKWRKGQIDYLERVCRGNLNKLSKIIDEIFKYAKDKNLKVSTSFYRKYGKGKKTKLRFSKFGKERGREKIFNCIYWLWKNNEREKKIRY